MAEINLAGEDRIAGFRLIRAIYAGPTAVTYEVLQDSTARRFAMKQLLASRATDSAERKLFEFEAKLGMTLRHPNLVRVVEYMKDPEQPYFIMDFFPSVGLNLPISRPSVHQLSSSLHHRILTEAASALAYMHKMGWIHRDIKPANMLVNPSGELRVIDFALAKKPYSSLRMLLGGKPKREGTPTYMSPEQIRCESPSIAADVYSFGITCYELACGRPPFRGNSTSELLNKHLSERPAALTSHNPRVTPEFNELVLKMIQKSPASRLANLDEFLIRFARIRMYTDLPEGAASRLSE